MRYQAGAWEREEKIIGAHSIVQESVTVFTMQRQAVNFVSSPVPP
jgi:hypothetical protein